MHRLENCGIRKGADESVFWGFNHIEKIVKRVYVEMYRKSFSRLTAKKVN